jgi:hypothetical protein
MFEIKNLLFTVNHHRTSASNDQQSCVARGGPGHDYPDWALVTVFDWRTVSFTNII